jgi:hypothetical protein
VKVLAAKEGTASWSSFYLLLYRLADVCVFVWCVGVGLIFPEDGIRLCCVKKSDKQSQSAEQSGPISTKSILCPGRTTPINTQGGFRRYSLTTRAFQSFSDVLTG